MDDIFVANLPASALTSNPNTAGLLSLAFFQLFGGGVEFTWSGGKPSITFSSTKTEESTAEKSMVPIQRLSKAGGLASLTVKINGFNVKALLAPGSPVSVMNEAAAKIAAVGKIAFTEEERKDLEARGDILPVMNEQGKPVDLVKSSDPVAVKAGEADAVDFGNVPIYVGKIPGMEAIGNDDNEPMLVLGLDVLVQRPSMLLRFQDNEVWFE